MVDGNDNCETIRKPPISRKKPVLSPPMRANQRSVKTSDQTSHTVRNELTTTANNNANNNPPTDGQMMDRTPCGSATPSPHVDEAYETPPCVRWGVDYDYLLNDKEGREIFREYLRDEEVLVILDFYFACEGLKSIESKVQIKKVVKAIYKLIKKFEIIQLSADVKKSLEPLKKLSSSTEDKGDELWYDQHVFDAAQQQVDQQLRGSIYTNFTKSPIYLKHLGGYSHPSSFGAVGGHSDSSHNTNDRTVCQMESSLDDYNTGDTQNNPFYDMLPTLHEDSELQTTNPSADVRHASNVNNRSHPQNRFQTLSDDNCHNLMSSGASEILQRGLNKIPSHRSDTSPRIFTESHPLSPNLPGRHNPAHQSYIRSKAMSNPPNPYHVKYSTILPTSAQDSEIQSMSSHSTNDSLFSSVSENDGNNNSGVRSKRHMNHMMKQNARLNSNQANPLRGNTFTMPLKNLKTHPPNANDAANPEKFAIELIQRLEKVRQQQENVEKNDKKLQEMLQLASGSSVVSNQENKSIVPTRPPTANPGSAEVSASGTSLLRERLKEKPVFDFCPEEEEQNQAILDDHFNHVFKTPIETPTDSIGRCISPPKQPNYRTYDHRMTPPVSQHIATSGYASTEPQVRVTVKYSNDQIPYVLYMRGHSITLRKFKAQIPVKPGNWQYYFKRKCDDELMDISVPYVMEKISDDNVLLPLINDKIFAELQESN